MQGSDARGQGPVKTQPGEFARRWGAMSRAQKRGVQQRMERVALEQLREQTGRSNAELRSQAKSLVESAIARARLA